MGVSLRTVQDWEQGRRKPSGPALALLRIADQKKEMRTTIVLDDDLVRRAQQLTGIRTKREVIDVALRTLVRLHEQSVASDLCVMLHWEGDLDESRQDRANAGS